MVTDIDYVKAFNRLRFPHCVRAFARKGASTQIIPLLATFLSNRTMSVRVANIWSEPRPVYGGVTQGSILGVMLFNIATDDLEDPDDHDPRVFVRDKVSSDSSMPGSLFGDDNLGDDRHPGHNHDTPSLLPLESSSGDYPGALFG